VSGPERGLEVRVETGRRCVQRAKSGEGKTVRDFTRMAITVSSRERCGLNWYLVWLR